MSIPTFNKNLMQLILTESALYLWPGVYSPRILASIGKVTLSSLTVRLPLILADPLRQSNGFGLYDVGLAVIFSCLIEWASSVK